ncbi:MAG TPA: SDR family oxidoreductase [Streptosporangiaceae bacterium]|jgi:NAD(P)-dependent dehydrogenase (short-subunit alcohol dehydrogenase family)
MTVPAGTAPDPGSPPRGYGGLFDLSGRDALVIGAGSGIGRESAIALAAFGARVTCADISLPAAELTAVLAAQEAALAAGGAGATAIELDMLDESAIEQAAAGRPDTDILVFTAATNVRKRILDYSAAEAQRVIDLNLRGPFALLRAFGAQMVARGGGSVIGFTSIRAVTTEPGQAMYAATKAGLVQLLRTAAAEWGPAGVRVNLIAPGVVETPLTRQIRDQPQWYAAYADKSMLGRWAQPGELAGAVVYLASGAASYVTGSVLTVDAGWTAADGRFTPPA